jgi:cysteinyl-tRNA synthetase, unknown class
MEAKQQRNFGWTTRGRVVMALGIVLAATSALADDSVSNGSNPLNNVHSFMYQLQGLEDRDSQEQLARSAYDMLIVEPTFTLKGEEAFNAKEMVAKLKAGKPGRIVVAYVDIGEAERFRSYWNASWKRPTKKKSGSPAFLLAPDPDGWKDDVSIAYWDEQWQRIWLGPDGVLRKIMAAGFDGIYMDWVEAYDEPRVVAEARKQGVDPTKAMVDFIAAIRGELRALRANAIVIAQNAPDLIDADRRYSSLIDGVGFEDTWFRGDADAQWNNAKGGDIRNDGKDEDSTAARLKQYQKFRGAGIPVFTIDYCLKPENAGSVYRAASNEGLIPLVTRVSLERMTTTPPPAIR